MLLQTLQSRQYSCLSARFLQPAAVALLPLLPLALLVSSASRSWSAGIPLTVEIKVHCSHSDAAPLDPNKITTTVRIGGKLYSNEKKDTPFFFKPLELLFSPFRPNRMKPQFNIHEPSEKEIVITVTDKNNNYRTWPKLIIFRYRNEKRIALGEIKLYCTEYADYREARDLSQKDGLTEDEISRLRLLLGKLRGSSLSPFRYYSLLIDITYKNLKNNRVLSKTETDLVKSVKKDKWRIPEQDYEQILLRIASVFSSTVHLGAKPANNLEKKYCEIAVEAAAEVIRINSRNLSAYKLRYTNQYRLDNLSASIETLRNCVARCRNSATCRELAQVLQHFNQTALAYAGPATDPLSSPPRRDTEDFRRPWKLLATSMEDFAQRRGCTMNETLEEIRERAERLSR